MEFLSALRVLGFTVARMNHVEIELVRGRRNVTVPRLASLEADEQRALLEMAGVSERDFAVVAFTSSVGAMPIALSVLAEELA